MAKLTRKSYKRKKVAFAAVVLGGVALVSSGFAAFVLSAGAEQKNPGNLEIGSVINGSLKMDVYSYNSAATDHKGAQIEKDKPLAEYFRFDADGKDEKTNTKGNGTKDGKISNRVYYKQEDDRLPATLEHTFVVEIISSTDSLSSFNVKMTINNDLSAAVSAGFITLPACTDAEGVTISAAGADNTWADKTGLRNDACTVKKETVTEGYKWTFEYKVAFAWGARFKNTNPCYFFDNEGTSKIDTGVTKTPRTDDEIGNCYGTTDSDRAVTLTPGWDVDIDTINADLNNWFFPKANNNGFNLTFTAEGM